jgi:putative peptide zinc metalloprotease protein
MGVGFYLFVPIFYTDVTESYRLGRYARVRTDLGGLYFHLLAGTVFIGVGALTGNEFLLVAAFLIDLDVARQLIPFIRLDGYWALADLTGIPDLLTHAGARVRRQLTKKQSGPVPPPLRRGVRRVLIGYVALAVPVVVAVMGYAAWHAPSIFTRTVAALSAHFELVSATIRLGEWGTALLAILEMILLVLPSLGLLFFFMVLARAVTRVLSLAPASPAAAAGAPPSGVAATAGSPAPPQRPRTRAGDGISFEAAIADHLELKRRHREPGSGSSRESRGHLRALAET